MNLRDLVGKRNEIIVIKEGKMLSHLELGQMVVSDLLETRIIVKGQEVKIEVPTRTTFSKGSASFSYERAGFFYGGEYCIPSGSSGGFLGPSKALEFITEVYAYAYEKALFANRPRAQVLPL